MKKFFKITCLLFSAINLLHGSPLPDNDHNIQKRNIFGVNSSLTFLPDLLSLLGSGASTDPNSENSNGGFGNIQTLIPLIGPITTAIINGIKIGLFNSSTSLNLKVPINGVQFGAVVSPPALYEIRPIVYGENADSAIGSESKTSTDISQNLNLEEINRKDEGAIVRPSEIVVPYMPLHSTTLAPKEKYHSGSQNRVKRQEPVSITTVEPSAMNPENSMSMEGLKKTKTFDSDRSNSSSKENSDVLEVKPLKLEENKEDNPIIMENEEFNIMKTTVSDSTESILTVKTETEATSITEPNMEISGAENFGGEKENLDPKNNSDNKVKNPNPNGYSDTKNEILNTIALNSEDKSSESIEHTESGSKKESTKLDSEKTMKLEDLVITIREIHTNFMKIIHDPANTGMEISNLQKENDEENKHPKEEYLHISTKHSHRETESIENMKMTPNNSNHNYEIYEKRENENEEMTDIVPNDLGITIKEVHRNLEPIGTVPNAASPKLKTPRLKLPGENIPLMDPSEKPIVEMVIRNEETPRQPRDEKNEQPNSEPSQTTEINTEFLTMTSTVEIKRPKETAESKFQIKENKPEQSMPDERNIDTSLEAKEPLDSNISKLEPTEIPETEKSTVIMEQIVLQISNPIKPKEFSMLSLDRKSLDSEISMDNMKNSSMYQESDPTESQFEAKPMEADGKLINFMEKNASIENKDKKVETKIKESIEPVTELIVLENKVPEANNVPETTQPNASSLEALFEPIMVPIMESLSSKESNFIKNDVKIIQNPMETKDTQLDSTEPNNVNNNKDSATEGPEGTEKMEDSTGMRVQTLVQSLQHRNSYSKNGPTENGIPLEDTQSSFGGQNNSKLEPIESMGSKDQRNLELTTIGSLSTEANLRPEIINGSVENMPMKKNSTNLTSIIMMVSSMEKKENTSNIANVNQPEKSTNGSRTFVIQKDAKNLIFHIQENPGDFMVQIEEIPNSLMDHLQDEFDSLDVNLIPTKIVEQMDKVNSNMTLVIVLPKPKPAQNPNSNVSIYENYSGVTVTGSRKTRQAPFWDFFSYFTTPPEPYQLRPIIFNIPSEQKMSTVNILQSLSNILGENSDTVSALTTFNFTKDEEFEDFLRSHHQRGFYKASVTTGKKDGQIFKEKSRHFAQESVEHILDNSVKFRKKRQVGGSLGDSFSLPDSQGLPNFGSTSDGSAIGLNSGIGFNSNRNLGAPSSGLSNFDSPSSGLSSLNSLTESNLPVSGLNSGLSNLNAASNLNLPNPGLRNLGAPNLGLPNFDLSNSGLPSLNVSPGGNLPVSGSNSRLSNFNGVSTANFGSSGISTSNSGGFRQSFQSRISNSDLPSLDSVSKSNSLPVSAVNSGLSGLSGNPAFSIVKSSNIKNSGQNFDSGLTNLDQSNPFLSNQRLSNLGQQNLGLTNFRLNPESPNFNSASNLGDSRFENSNFEELQNNFDASLSNLNSNINIGSSDLRTSSFKGPNFSQDSRPNLSNLNQQIPLSDNSGQTFIDDSTANKFAFNLQKALEEENSFKNVFEQAFPNREHSGEEYQKENTNFNSGPISQVDDKFAFDLQKALEEETSFKNVFEQAFPNREHSGEEYQVLDNPQNSFETTARLSNIGLSNSVDPVLNVLEQNLPSTEPSNEIYQENSVSSLPLFPNLGTVSPISEPMVTQSGFDNIFEQAFPKREHSGEIYHTGDSNLNVDFQRSLLTNPGASFDLRKALEEENNPKNVFEQAFPNREHSGEEYQKENTFNSGLAQIDDTANKFAFDLRKALEEENSFKNVFEQAFPNREHSGAEYQGPGETLGSFDSSPQKFNPDVNTGNFLGTSNSNFLSGSLNSHGINIISTTEEPLDSSLSEQTSLGRNGPIPKFSENESDKLTFNLQKALEEENSFKNVFEQAFPNREHSGEEYQSGDTNFDSRTAAQIDDRTTNKFAFDLQKALEEENNFKNVFEQAFPNREHSGEEYQVSSNEIFPDNNRNSRLLQNPTNFPLSNNLLQNEISGININITLTNGDEVLKVLEQMIPIKEASGEVYQETPLTGILNQDQVISVQTTFEQVLPGSSPNFGLGVRETSESLLPVVDVSKIDDTVAEKFAFNLEKALREENSFKNVFDQAFPNKEHSGEEYQTTETSGNFDNQNLGAFNNQNFGLGTNSVPTTPIPSFISEPQRAQNASLEGFLFVVPNLKDPIDFESKEFNKIQTNVALSPLSLLVQNNNDISSTVKSTNIEDTLPRFDEIPLEQSFFDKSQLKNSYGETVVDQRK